MIDTHTLYSNTYSTSRHSLHIYTAKLYLCNNTVPTSLHIIFFYLHEKYLNDKHQHGHTKIID